MLIQYTKISSLDQAAKNRLAAQAKQLLMTTEASRGHVMFEGKHFSVSEVQQLISQSRQFLAEG
jgi:hypothetical protein